MHQSPLLFSNHLFYFLNIPNLKLLKYDVDKYIDADEDYIRIKQKVDYLKTICDYLDKTIKQISNRGFLIKDAIEWRKFTSGAI